MNGILIIGAFVTFGRFACWTAFTGIAAFSLGEQSYEITDQVRDLPAIQRHIGDIQWHYIDPIAAGAAREGGVDFDYYLDLSGTTGQGVLLVSMDGRRIRTATATLILPSGEEIAVVEE